DRPSRTCEPHCPACRARPMRPLRSRLAAPLRLLCRLVLCASAAFPAGAFCASPAWAASDAVVVAQQDLQSVAPAAAPPDAPAAMPAADLPAAAAPDAALPAAPSSRSADIALVLPLASPDYARAAAAVRDGFLDAADAAGARPRVVVIGHGAGEVVAAFTQARDAGADISLPPTIALNQLDDGTPLPPLIYTLALAVESDARVIARRARTDGAINASVIEADTPLMKRFAGAFTAQWLLDGGNPPHRFSFAATPDGLTKLRRDLADVPADVVVIAVEGSDLSLVKSFAPHVTTYASAQINRSATLG